MSPKFGLAFLLLCFVLLGLSDAQRHQGEYRVNGQYKQYLGRHTGGGGDLGGDLGGDHGGNHGGDFGTNDAGPQQPNNGGVNCNPNILASGQKDRFAAGKR